MLDVIGIWLEEDDWLSDCVSGTPVLMVFAVVLLAVRAVRRRRQRARMEQYWKDSREGAA